MNENINLVKILIGCSIGTELYCPVYGTVNFKGIEKHGIVKYLIKCEDPFTGRIINVTSDGKLYNASNGECILFPSKEQRDWSKFKTAKFDPENFKPFDKVLVRTYRDWDWAADIVSHYRPQAQEVITVGNVPYAEDIIPYNIETCILIGTNKDCPDFYKWWEN
jgi:hypothetical protein